LRLKSSTRIAHLIAAAGLGLAATSAHAANGCANGNYSTTVSPDGNATSFLFDNLSASSQDARRTTCRVSAKVTEGKGYSVFAVDYRGFTVKTADQSVTLSGGKKGDRALLLDPAGPYGRDFQINRRMGSGNSDHLDLSLLLTAGGLPGDVDPAEIYLDSIDVSRIGYMTEASLQQSLDGLAEQRRAIMVRAYSATSQIFGLNEPRAGDSHLAAFTGTDGTTGIKARWDLDENLTFLGGVAALDAGSALADADTALLLAGAVRYRQPIDAAWGVFGELGGWGSPDLGATYDRSYMNGDTLVSNSMDAAGSLMGVHARMGIAYAPDAGNEFSVSARLARSMFNVASYRERAGDDNLFAARISGRTTTSDTADLTVAWTRRVTDTVDYTLSATLGREFANDAAVRADIAYVGKADGGWEARTYGSLGARLGWNFHSNWSVDTSAGVALREHDQPDWNVGLQLKTTF